MAAKKAKAPSAAKLKAAPKAKGKKNAQVPFTYKLVLNQWMLSLFGVKRFEDLAEHLRNEKLEGLDENNIHHFHHALTAQFFNLTYLSTELLLEYDQNIVKHTQRLNERRITGGEEPIVWKYFQYLTLLFTEVYLDRYFRDAVGLLKELNQQVAVTNTDWPEVEQISPFDEDAEAWPQLNKLAYLSATGSGKTLLMHANILQYQFYLDKYGRRRELNRIILLTPNEGLSTQHLGEFEKAGISAELFNGDGRGLFAGQAVEVIDIYKLKDEKGGKTFAIDAFEGNNLVLVDEGHRGTVAGQDGPWMRYRNALCEKGFSFEYSATFTQAVKGNKKLIDTYARSILFDYSYRYFYGDGFGKDYQIFNLDVAIQTSHLESYLVACLLAFYQQQRLYREQESAFRPFNIEKPLWIFVGSSVAKSDAHERTDIVKILQFLARYVADRAGSIQRIEHVLNQGLVAADGKNLFAGRFTYLNTAGLSSAQVFEDTLSTLFNAEGGGLLHVENLRGAPGEVALRVGDNDPFGVINVGEDAKLVALCKENGLETGDREFRGSLFDAINEQHSTVNVLIGAKKFTEGWNSWRVSTMGLMNVGKTEGSQIIQLFGRGVRLKGYGMSLKRSGKTQLPDEVSRPKHIHQLETLSIFGIDAEYMTTFRDFLEEEGLPKNDDRELFLLPVINHLGTQKLKMIRLKKIINGVSTEGSGDAFRKLGPVPTIAKPDPVEDKSTSYLQKNQLVLNWYPKIKALKSGGVVDGNEESAQNRAHLKAEHVAFLDLDKLYFELERYKAERGWYNLNLKRENIIPLLTDQSWYQLLIPAEELAFDSFERVRLWQEIALSLLKAYTERYYRFRKREWELPHLEYQYLSPDDPNFLGSKDEPDKGYYRILIDKSQEEIAAKLTELKDIIAKGDLKPWEFQGMKAIWFGRHLYEPLLHVGQKIVEISPVPLNKGERRFVEDLKAFHENDGGYFAGKELYLLRNLSKGRGVGFFEAGNFHPDFILWLLTGDRQHIVFVDPKGIRNIGADDDRIRFYETIKEIEQRLADPNVQLDSFIISSTPSHTVRMLWNLDKPSMKQRHVLFQEEDQDTYIREMLQMVVPV